MSHSRCMFHLFKKCHQRVWELQLLHTLTNTGCGQPFPFRQRKCEVASHCGFVGISLTTNDAEHLIMCYLLLVYFLWGNVFLIFCPVFSYWAAYFFLLSLEGSLFWVQTLCQICALQIFPLNVLSFIRCLWKSIGFSLR